MKPAIIQLILNMSLLIGLIGITIGIVRMKKMTDKAFEGWRNALLEHKNRDIALKVIIKDIRKKIKNTPPKAIIMCDEFIESLEESIKAFEEIENVHKGKDKKNS